MTTARTGCYRLIDQRRDDEGALVETFASSAHVGSPWGPDLQHGGPVGALLTRALERHAPRPGTRLTRVSVDLLGPVPLAEVRTAAVTVRPGRNVELVAARMEARGPDGGWRRVARAEAWRLALQPTEDVVREPAARLALPDGAPSRSSREVFAASWSDTGFVASLEFKDVVHGAAPGEPTTAWMRLTCPLVEGEPDSPLAGAIALADVANGLGARLDPLDFSFPNADLVVHLHAPPSGSWFGLAAETAIGPDGVGLSQAVLHDRTGPIGRVAQNLLVARRAGGRATERR